MDDTADTVNTPPAPAPEKPKPAVKQRDERLAARLRENLRKRKEQARQRGE
ncbi:hypothetical protein JHL17_09705 [Azospirillum sp. YIM B02556]|uniref:Uncharacterized protein n=1 Tax=Azospirillum endophyticum TaxID=2800326 RepID=A0ABS1F2Q6_9PROT|nr:hypothetical protein [Azospirillum endophyticum]MBK1837688.1 hypothetical protein [Azospirillum endophyticum]